MIKADQEAYAFDLPDQTGKRHRLSDYLGRWVVLYFYPKDGTSGCTKEACSFRDGLSELHALGAVVLGVSKDDIESHGRFSKRHALNFSLLSDPDSTVIRAYGAWGKKNMYGKVHEGTLRQTFLINPKGRVAGIWKKVKTDTHAADVATALKGLAGGA